MGMEVMMMAWRRHGVHPPHECFGRCTKVGTPWPSSGCDGIDAGQGKAKHGGDVGGSVFLDFSIFGFLGVMINHVCCRGYGVFTVVVSRIDKTFLSRWKI